MGNVSPLVIEQRLKALIDQHHTVEKIADGFYLVHRVAHYYVAIDFWRMTDGSAQGYGARGMLDAIDAAQLRSMIIEPAAVTPQSPAVTGRDNPLGKGLDPDKSQPLNSQPQRVESVTAGVSIPPDATVVVIDPLSSKLPKVDWS